MEETLLGQVFILQYQAVDSYTLSAGLNGPVALVPCAFYVSMAVIQGLASMSRPGPGTGELGQEVRACLSRVSVVIQALLGRKGQRAHFNSSIWEEADKA